MASSSEETGRGWLAEGLLIVVSILVAFAIDAGWEERQEREQERRVLESLRAEFLVNIEMLAQDLRVRRLSADSADQVLRGLVDAAPDGVASLPGVAVANTLSHGSTDLQRGALDAVLQSGELRYLESRTLRESLARWPRDIVDATENEELLRTIHGPEFTRVLSRHADLAVVVSWDSACWDTNPPKTCEAYTVTVPYDKELLGVLLQIVGFTHEAVRELGVLEDEARQLVALLDRELARFD